MTLEDFLKDYYQAAMRIAKSDEAFNECLVLKFSQFLKDYDGATGDPGGYVLMRLKFAVLKYSFRERRWQQRFGSEIVVDPPEVTEETVHIPLESLPDDIRQVIELWSHGWSQHDIASELGMSIRKVRACTNAGITMLRRELTDALSTRED